MSTPSIMIDLKISTFLPILQFPPITDLTSLLSPETTVDFITKLPLNSADSEKDVY